MEFPSEIIDQVHQLYDSAQTEAQRLRVAAEEAAQTERVWTEFEQFLRKGWVFHIVGL